MIELPSASPSFVHWLAALLLLSRLGDVISTYLFTPTLYALAIAIHGASFYLRLSRLTQNAATPTT